MKKFSCGNCKEDCKICCVYCEVKYCNCMILVWLIGEKIVYLMKKVLNLVCWYV